MRATHVGLLILGVLLFLAGLTFTLQGYGMVGPSGSFMFQNKTWIYSGSVVLVVGLLLAFAAIYASTRKPKAPPAVAPAV